MGTLIHVLTEIYKDGKWMQVYENPESIVQSGYREYGVLAGVRDSFKQQLFDVKGLPEDIDKPYAQWESRRDFLKKLYNENGKSMLVFNNPDGSKSYEDIFSRETEIEIDEAFYNILYKENKEPSRYYWLSYRCDGNTGKKTYHVHDAAVVGAKYQEVPYKVLYSTLEEYLKAECEEDWDERAQDYGSYHTDFTDECCDAHSYLTLAELKSADYTKYNSVSYKLDRDFYNKFIENGGVFPECFTFSESGMSGLIDAFREAMEPTITVSWLMKDEEIQKLDMHNGIRELENIAKQYGVADSEIRIVFAFS